MKLLLDTHALVWWLLGRERMTLASRVAIDDDANQVLVSSVSAFELALKHRIGKFPEVAGLVQSFAATIAQQKFEQLAIGIEHGLIAGGLPIPHKDPFDRMLIAQAQVESAWLVSNEELFDGFGVRRLW